MKKSGTQLIREYTEGGWTKSFCLDSQKKRQYFNDQTQGSSQWEQWDGALFRHRGVYNFQRESGAGGWHLHQEVRLMIGSVDGTLLAKGKRGDHIPKLPS